MPRVGIEIDVRGVDVVAMHERCHCGAEYISELHLRHECRECNLKWLYPPHGIKPVPLTERLRALWQRFLDWMDSE